MLPALNLILKRWEVSPPVFGAEEARIHLQPLLQRLVVQAILRPARRASAYTCKECNGRGQVTHFVDSRGSSTAYLQCECGISAVSDEELQRWEIDTVALLGTVFQAVAMSLQEHVVGHLWRVGKANWAGRSREVLFARCFRRDAVATAGDVLRRHSKAIVFAPTEVGAARWHDVAGNLTISLESAISFDASAISLDVAYVEGQIDDAGLGAEAPAISRHKKRARRAANIEALKNELIQHLRAARDHAFAAKDRTGEAELLPRPTQKELGKRAGLSESDVSRCLSDESARELKLYWETAQDLHQIMAWKRPVKRGRTT